jgi:hypothetical protein
VYPLDSKLERVFEICLPLKQERKLWENAEKEILMEAGFKFMLYQIHFDSNEVPWPHNAVD